MLRTNSVQHVNLVPSIVSYDQTVLSCCATQRQKQFPFHTTEDDNISFIVIAPDSIIGMSQLSSMVLLCSVLNGGHMEVKF